MRLITILFAAAGLAAAAGTASAAGTDVEFLKASRCRGLAEGAGVTDTASLDAYLKAEGRYRTSVLMDRARDAQDSARREAKSTNEQRKARVATELAGPCQAFKS